MKKLTLADSVEALVKTMFFFIVLYSFFGFWIIALEHPPYGPPVFFFVLLFTCIISIDYIFKEN